MDTELYRGLALVCPGNWNARKRRKLMVMVEMEPMLASVKERSAACCLFSLLSGFLLLASVRLCLPAALRLLFL